MNSNVDFGPEIRRRIGIANKLMDDCKRMWKWRNVKRELKVKLYEVLILSVLLYDAEVWVVTKNHLQLLESFHHCCLKRLNRNSYKNKRPSQRAHARARTLRRWLWRCLERFPQYCDRPNRNPQRSLQNPRKVPEQVVAEVTTKK